MKRCPNCNREAMRTKDWVCQWCGYPLTSESYKKIDKTFKELKEERTPRVQTVEEDEAEVVLAAESESITEVETEVAVEPELEFEPEIEPEETALVGEVETEPTPKPVSKPKAKARRKTTAGRKTNSRVRAKTEAVEESEPAPEEEIEPIAEIETESIASVEPENEPVAAAEVDSPAVAEREPETPPALAAMEMTVAEMLSAYENDGEEADARFANQAIRITGVIDRIEARDALNIYYINLKSGAGSRLLESVRCVFDSQYGSELSKLEVGQTVTVQGIYDGSIIDISLKDCRLVG